ncbi:adenylyl-sulfate kinase [Desulfuribacillus alkaliarsenatis]|uniref:Adenylyl-sulfate kinase n=1 Tax=Desulfuribacillus alkaliarsenatis TaxID=766136 RepID=A0A1E5G1N4_9FIRM|nr:adenylyl-sulfate kinase [Desulfuribacillus alkaliarsenatis]OEF96820.1 adenylyl-sulfate kinase [Desulfuribacillus alkaliarsenatis]
MEKKSSNIMWHNTTVSKEDRRELNKHSSCVVWFTGLSGAGKSTLATEVEKRLHQQSIRTYVLDGDNIRHGLNNNLGFSPEDRKENIRRIGEVAKLFVDAGIFVMTAFISPYRKDRLTVRSLLETDEFIEVYVKCSLDECEKRDPKGLYSKARAGQIPEFTGISAPYEEPLQAEITIETDKHTLDESADIIIDYLKQNKYIN